MTKEEIAGGLKNAMERGYSLEQAVQSFINSGYNPDEVREAANLITQGGVSSIIQPAVTAQAISSQQTPLFTEEGVPQPPQPSQETFAATASVGSVVAAEVVKAKPKKKWLVIALVVLLAVLAGSIIALTLFRDQIIKLISGVF